MLGSRPWSSSYFTRSKSSFSIASRRQQALAWLLRSRDIACLRMIFEALVKLWVRAKVKAFIWYESTKFGLAPSRRRLVIIVWSFFRMAICRAVLPSS